VNPSDAIDFQFTTGNSTPTFARTFTNYDNETFSMALNVTGDGKDFIQLSISSVNFVGNSTSNLQVTFNIPSSTTPNLYSAKINYFNGYIPVYINVKQPENPQDCRIIATPSEYEYSVRKGTLPYTQDFPFRISSKCKDGVEITDLKVSGGILLPSGFQPARLTGGLPKGFHDGGESSSYSLEFDVSELTVGTYTSFVTITGIGDDESLTTSIKFKVTVVGVATPVGDIITPPIFDPIPAELSLNNSYTITARNVNPNIKIHIDPNEYIYGENVDIAGDSWVFKFRPAKIGNTVLRVWAEYQGGQIGEPLTQEVRIISTRPSVGGVNLSFQFFPEIANLKPGDKLTVLLKDSKNGNIVTDAQIYVNGVVLTGNTIDGVASGTTYTLAGTSLGYNTLETTFSISSQGLSVSISPSSPQVGDSITFSTESNATIYWNDAVITNPYVANTAGTFSLRVSKDGFADYNTSVTVLETLSFLTAIPERIKIGEVVGIDLNRAVPWSVIYATENSTEVSPTLLFSDNTPRIQFVPQEKGFYQLQVNNAVIKSWTVGGFNWAILFYVLIGAVVLFIVIKLIGRKGSNTEGPGYYDLQQPE